MIESNDTTAQDKYQWNRPLCCDSAVAGSSFVSLAYFSLPGLFSHSTAARWCTWLCPRPRLWLVALRNPSVFAWRIQLMLTFHFVFVTWDSFYWFLVLIIVLQQFFHLTSDSLAFCFFILRYFDLCDLHVKVKEKKNSNLCSAVAKIYAVQI